MKNLINENTIPAKIFTKSILLIFLLSAATLFAQNAKMTGSQQQQKINGDSIFEAEKLLAERGYWITKIDRQKDASTYHAVAAFQKVEGRKRTGVLTVRELEAFRASSRPKAIFSGAAHIEIDLSRQVLFLTDDGGTVTYILPVSTGSGEVYYEKGKRQIAYTPRGVFEITRQIKGTRRAPLGLLYHPNYFSGGVAIHGSDSIPFYPASHGCVRIPRFAAKDFSDLVSVGMKVYVFENADRASLDKSKKIEFENLPCETEK